MNSVERMEEIKQLRAALSSEKKYLRSINITDFELRADCIENIVRISNEIENLRTR